MLRSLYSGVSGLRNHQLRMDVIGNNIANVNTSGFKASRVVFQDIYSQTLRPASGATATTGGTNPQQIGLGVALATIDVLHTRTGSQYTGEPLDLAIEGDGFFVVNDGTSKYYTRLGNFKLDNSGTTVPNPPPTTAPAGGYTATCATLVNANGLRLQGVMATGNPATIPSPYPATLGSIVIDTSKYSDVTIDKNGMVIGVDATNNKVTIAQIAVASFNNQSALEKMGESLYASNSNSGAEQIKAPGSVGAAKLNPGALEMSNVDLAKEFTDMITTQRGFQANSRIITTSDSLLEELVNLKRQ